MNALRVCAVALAAITVASLAAGVRAADAPAPVTIRIGGAGQDIDAEMFYAQELGFFRKYGIVPDMTIIRKGGGAAAVAAVAGGALDIGEGDLVSVATARQRGIPIALIAPSGLYRSTAPTTELIVATASPIRSAKDFEGKTIALISLEGPSRIATNAWLENNGAVLDRVTFIELPPVNMAAAVERGTVAGAVINEPALTASQSCCRVVANNFQSIGSVWQLNAYYASADWIAKNPLAARHFVQAIREAADWANRPENHAKSGAILNKYTPFAPELLAKMNRATYAETLEPRAMQPLLDAAYKYKALPAPATAQSLIGSLPAP